jgi:hypothetical protein
MRKGDGKLVNLWEGHLRGGESLEQPHSAEQS